MPFQELQVNLNADDLKHLGGVLTEVVRDLEEIHDPLFRDISIWWKWYYAEPRVRQRSFPWRNASNLVVPLIRTHSDVQIARRWGTLQGRRDIWTGRAENEVFVKEGFLDNAMRFLNWANRNEFDTFLPSLDWITENEVVGSSVIGLTWEESRRHLLVPGSRKPQEFLLHRGPKIQHWPAHLILWDPTQDIRHSEMVVTQSFLSWPQMVQMIRREGWREDAVKATKNHRHIHSTRGASVEDESHRRAGLDYSRRMTSRPIYDVRRVWVDWPWLKDVGIAEERIIAQNKTGTTRMFVPLVIELAPDSRQVLRVLPNPYTNLEGNPFYEIYNRRRPGGLRGEGNAKILEQLQRGVTTSVNQAHDAVTLANAIPFITSDPKLKDQRLQPGQGVFVDNIQQFREVQLSKGVLPDIAIVNLLMAIAQNASGSHDVLQGRDLRSGGHPSPATNFLGLLEQANKLAAPKDMMVRRGFSKLAEDTLSLYQLFGTNDEGRLRRIFGAQDAQQILEVVFPAGEPIAGNISFDVFAMSETQNPQQQAEQALLATQVNQNYFSIILRILPALESPQTPPATKQAIVKAIDSMATLHQRFLETVDVDEAKEVVMRLQDTGVQNAQLLNQFADVVRQAAGPAAPGALGSQEPVPGAGLSGTRGNGAAGPASGGGGDLVFQ